MPRRYVRRPRAPSEPATARGPPSGADSSAVAALRPRRRCGFSPRASDSSGRAGPTVRDGAIATLTRGRTEAGTGRRSRPILQAASGGGPEHGGGPAPPRGLKHQGRAVSAGALAVAVVAATATGSPTRAAAGGPASAMARPAVVAAAAPDGRSRIGERRGDRR